MYAPCCSSIIILAEQQVSWKGIPEGIKVGLFGFLISMCPLLISRELVNQIPLCLELHGYVPDSSLELVHLMP